MLKKTQKSKLKTPDYAGRQKSLVKNKEDENKSSGELEKKAPKLTIAPKNLKEPETMEELLKQTGGFVLGVKKGDNVEGIVVSVSSREILLDIGKKSFGIVAEWELEQVKDYAATLKVGEKIAAQVVNPENDIGYAILSLRKTTTEIRWKTLHSKKELGEDIEVVGLDIAKGGILIEWQNLRGFIPGTQLDSSFSNNPGFLIGKKIKVKVLEVDQSLNRLVLSQKASSLGISPEVMKEKLNKVKTTDVLKGTISGIAPFGLFVDVDGLEGLVHISEIAWEKVINPSSLYKIGDKVDIMVIDVNQGEGKLNLSIKRLTPDPWKNILDRYPRDSTVSGKIVRLAPYGAFVKLEVGIEGLIHISKIPTGEEPKVGQSVECIVENVDEVKRKISLTFVPKEKPVGYR